MKTKIYLCTLVATLIITMLNSAKAYGIVSIPDYQECFTVDGLSFIFVTPEKKAVKLVDGYNHCGSISDSLDPSSYNYYENGANFVVPESIIFEGVEYPVTHIERLTLVHSTLETLKFPSSLRVIEEYCGISAKLHDIEFQEGTSVIMDYCFHHLENLTEITFPNSLFQIQDECFFKTALSTINFGDGLYYIGRDCFTDNSNLEEVQLPKFLSKLGDGSFNNNPNLKRVYIPSYMVSLGKTFNGCPNIEEVFFTSRNSTDWISRDCFMDVDKEKCVFIVPDGCKNFYQNSLPEGSKIIEKSDYSGVTPVIEKYYDSTEDWSLDGQALSKDVNARYRLIKQNAQGHRVIIR